MYANIYMHIYINIYIYMYVYIHIYIYTYTREILSGQALHLSTKTMIQTKTTSIKTH